MRVLSKYLLYELLIICIFITIYLLIRGTVYNDEGYIVNSALRIINGEKIYKDFHFAYTPISAYFSATLLLLFNQNILSQRIGVGIITFSTALVLYLLTKNITKTAKLHLFPLFAYLAWGPSHINFIWPVMLCIPCIFLCSLYIEKFEKSKKSKYLIIAGIFNLILFLVKQNFGLGILLFNCVYISITSEKNKLKNIYYFFIGNSIIFIIFAIYLLFSNSFYFFINDFWDYTIERIIFEKSLDTPFFYGENLIKKLVKAAFYLLPFFISLVAILFSLKNKNKKELLVASYILIFYLLGIRPTTDLVHLVPLLSLIGLPLLIIILNIKYHFVKKVLNSLYIIFIVLGFYTAIFSNYYRWYEPLYQNEVFNQKFRIWLSKEKNLEIKKIEEYTKCYSNQNEYIFVFDYQPLVYFITNKKNPTKFDLISYNNYFYQAQSEILSDLRDKKINLILTNKSIAKDKNKVEDFILNNYQKIGESQNFFYWTNLNKKH